MMTTRPGSRFPGGSGAEKAMFAAAGVVTLVVAGSIVLGGGDDRDIGVGPKEPLPAAVVTDIVDTELSDVRLPPYREQDLREDVAAAGLTDQEEVVGYVDRRLGEWNLTLDGDLRENHCRPEAAACVDVGNLMAWLQENGEVIYGPVPVAVGGPETPTPTGDFSVVDKQVDDLNPVWGLPPRPFAVFLDWNGLALRQGPLMTPSEGAVHLDAADAPTFFDRLEVGEAVQLL
ncbi:L,D-transpeptidase [Corynebacterium sp. 335C]